MRRDGRTRSSGITRSGCSSGSDPVSLARPDLRTGRAHPGQRSDGKIQHSSLVVDLPAILYFTGAAPGGRIVLESYHDWVVDQREKQRKKGIWSESDLPSNGLHTDPFEEHITGLRASRAWKERLAIKRQYTGVGAV